MKNHTSLGSSWPKLCVLNLFIASVIGVLMRYKMMFRVNGLIQSNLLHAHSHFVFYGWVSLILFTCFLLFLLPAEAREKKSYSIQFWLMQFCSFGMLVTFLYAGYNPISIAFSALSQFVFYWFAFCFIRDMRFSGTPRIVKLFAITAVLWALLSSIGPYGLGYYSSTGTASAVAMRTTIYFYLHFQYNGWFIFAIFALFFQWLHLRNIHFPNHSMNWFFGLLTVSMFPGYSLSLVGFFDNPLVVYTAYLAVLLQIVAVILFSKEIIKHYRQIGQNLTPIIKILWTIAFFSLWFKTGSQALSVLPGLPSIAFSFRSLVIGYLHLVFLCLVSFFLLGLLFYYLQLNYSKSVFARVGFSLFWISTIVSEFFLFLHALGFYFSINFSFIPITLLYVTIGMSFGLLLFLFGQLGRKKDVLSQQISA